MKKQNSKNRTQKPSPLGKVGLGLKICGQKQNIEEVAALKPDYLGFIFWEPSPRHFDIEMPELASNTRKVGVFVDALLEDVLQKVKKYHLDAIQLHGNETPEYSKELAKLLDLQVFENLKAPHSKPEIIKVFSIKDTFDFSILKAYENACDFFLFDTKGKLPGGNGYTFNWEVLKKYPSDKPYFLSGGIGLENVQAIASFLRAQESEHCYAIDINSKFEIEPGLKDMEKIKEFKKLLENELSR